MVAVAARKETCARCGQVIKRNQIPAVWHDNVVCERCHGRLRALEPAMALSKALRPRLQFGKGAPESPAAHHPGQILGRCVAAMKKTFHI